jgi:hypothetical protein
LRKRTRVEEAIREPEVERSVGDLQPVDIAGAFIPDTDGSEKPLIARFAELFHL